MSPEEWLASKKEKESIPSPEEWLASKKSKDEVLSPEEWLAMKSGSREDPEVKENYKKESKGFSPSIVVGIPGAGMVIPTTPQRTQKSVDEEQKKRVDKAEEEQGTAESITRTVAGLGTEIAIAESSKVAGTALGAKLGALGGPSAPVTIPTGAAIGYVSGAVFGGVSGSIAAQRIEGKNEINWGRVAVDTVLNLVPGTKVTKGPKALRSVTAAMARNPVITNAAIGAVAGPASEAAQRYHETGEIPDYADLVASGMLSSTLGAGLGYSQQKMLPILRRFVGKSSDEINDLVNKGDSGAIAYVNALTADVDPQEFLTTERVLEYVGTLSNTAKARIAPSKLIGPRATQAMRDAGNMVIAGKEVGSALGSRVNAKIRESADPAAMQELAMEYLIGKSQTLPKELSSLQDDLSLARKYIKEYQDGLLEMHYNGQRELPELLLKKIEASRNEGDYLTRSYAFFDDKGYFPSKKDTEDLINDLTTRPMVKVDKREFVTRTNPDGSKVQIENPDFGKEYEVPPMTIAEAETYIANLNLKKADNPDELHNWIYTQNAGILKEKKDLSPALRKYLGEYQTPGEQISQTMSKLSRLVAYDRADYQISTILKDAGILKFAGEGTEGLQPIKLRRGNARIDGEELYGLPELQVAINGLYASKADDASMNFAESTARDLWQTFISSSKAAKTVFNPASYSANLWGSVSNMIGMGMNPFIGAKTGMKFAAGQYEPIAKRFSVETIDEFKRKKELGLIPPGLTFADIQAGLKSGRVGAVAQKVITPLGKAYSASDTALRIATAKNYEQQLLKQFPGAKLSDVEREAARFTNNTFQNYDYVNKNFKTLSRYGVPFGQFATFTVELIRNQYNQGKLIAKMLNGSYGKELAEKFGVQANQNAIRAEALKRIAGLTVVYAGATAGTQNLMERLGMDREKERAMRETILPEYGENKPIIGRVDISNGEVDWMNTSYLIPQQQLIGPFAAGFNNRSFLDAMKVGIQGVSEDIIGEGSFTMNALVQAMANYDFDKGGPISVSPDQTQNRVDRADFFIKDNLEPGFLVELEKMRSRKVKTTVQRMFGLRWNQTTIDKGFGFRAKKIKDSLNTSKAEIGFMLNRLQDNKITQDDFEAAYQKSNQAHRANLEVLGKHVNNLRTLGMSNDSIIRLMRDRGIGSEIALAALNGDVLDAPKIRRDTITDMYENMLDLPRKEIEAKIRETMREDMGKGKALLAKHKQYLKEQALKISEVDKAVGFLDAADGTRARYIFREMQRSSDSDAVLRNYMRKGLVNAEIYSQIKQLSQNAQESN